MKTNIFKYLKFLIFAAFSSAVMFTAAFGACATTVNVGGQGMTKVGNLTGVTTDTSNTSSAVNVGVLMNATREEVRLLAVPFTATKEYNGSDLATSSNQKTLLQLHTDVCGELNSKKFSLGKTNLNLTATWEPLTIEKALALHLFLTVPPVKELNLDTANNNLIEPDSPNYNRTTHPLWGIESNAFGLAADQAQKVYQSFPFAPSRFGWKLTKDDILGPLSLGKLGSVYPSGNQTDYKKRFGNDWYPLCYTKSIRQNGQVLFKDGINQGNGTLYWYPTLQ